MKKNDLFKKEGTIIRVLGVQTDKVLIVDCIKPHMPEWIASNEIPGDACDEEVLWQELGFEEEPLADLDSERRNKMYQRYTMIAGIIPFVGDKKIRAKLVKELVKEYHTTRQTITLHLCRYLAIQNIQSLLPKEHNWDRELTEDEKTMRWSLNKFFYNGDKNSLNMAYKMMLKTRYCDDDGKLLEVYPTFYQFRYFYRKMKKLQNFYISRDGLTNYQRNNRPCTGDGVQEYAPAPGEDMIWKNIRTRTIMRKCDYEGCMEFVKEVNRKKNSMIMKNENIPP